MKHIGSCAGRLPMAATYLVAVALWAQDVTLPTPQYDEVFYRYDPVAQKLIDLERQVATIESKPKAMGFSGYKVSHFLRGSHSTVRFRQSDPLEFVVSLPQRTDPHVVQFFSLREAGHRRELVEAQSNRPSPLGVGTAKDMRDKSTISYEIRKYGESAYRLIPSKPLPPGEYALSFPTSEVAFAFGIDGEGGQGGKIP